jgi:hypothetical protein
LDGEPIVGNPADAGNAEDGSQGGGAEADAGSEGVDAAMEKDDAGEDCSHAAVGGVCMHEGAHCAPYCADSCSACVSFMCKGGRWVDAGPPCSDPPNPYYNAWMSWQAPGGVVGLGPALVVDATGRVQVWEAAPPFDPDVTPRTPPDATYNVGTSSANTLFSAWFALDASALPHTGVASECSGRVYVKMCPTCNMSISLSYSSPTQLAPELNSVWQWFDAVLPASDNGAHPRNYCGL